MSRTIGRWGDTLTISVPEALAEQLHWDENTEVVCTVVDGGLLVVPAPAAANEPAQLAAEIAPESRQAEMSATEPERAAARRRALDALALRGSPPPQPAGGWRSTVGMFADDPGMQEIFEAGRRIREAERDAE